MCPCYTKLFLVFSLLCSVGFGQTEFNTRKSLNIVKEDKSALPLMLPAPKSSSEKLLLKYKVDKTQKEEGDIGFLPKSNMKSAKELYEEKTAYERADQSIEEFMRNQNFGNISTSSAFVNVLCRDHENVDGDMVAIYLNDRLIVPNIVLEESFKGFKIPLQKGFNKIDFVALNEGFYAPNTAEFEVYDDNKNVVFSERWILAKGFKATVLFIKE